MFIAPQFIMVFTGFDLCIVLFQLRYSKNIYFVQTFVGYWGVHMDETEEILERARRREDELNKENESADKLSGSFIESTKVIISEVVSSNANESTAIKDVKLPTLYPREELERLKRKNGNETREQNLNIDAPSELPVKKCYVDRSRFAALTAAIETYKVETKSHGSTPKENYLKKPQTRVSVGETRPSVLFAPKLAYPYSSTSKISTSNKENLQNPSNVEHENGLQCPSASETGKNLNVDKNIVSSVPSVESVVDEFEVGAGKQLRFANPMCSVAMEDASSLEVTEDERMPMIDDSVVGGPLESTAISRSSVDGSTDEEEYGIHTFFKRLAEHGSSHHIDQYGSDNSYKRRNEKSESEPYAFGPVTSSPKPFNPSISNASVNCVKVVPSETAVSQNASVDEKVTTASEKNSSSTSSNGDSVSIHESSRAGSRTKALAIKLEQKLREDNEAVLQKHISNEKIDTRGKPFAQTRPSVWIPQRIGAVSEQIRRFELGVPVSSPIIDTRSANVQNLKTRWEVSSASGAPLHPDQNEDELLMAAMKMSKELNPPFRRLPRTTVKAHTPTKNDCLFVPPNTPADDHRTVVRESSVTLGPEKPPRIFVSDDLKKTNDAQVQPKYEYKFDERGDQICENSVGTITDTEESQKVVDDVFKFIDEIPSKDVSLVSSNAEIIKTPGTTPTKFVVTPDNSVQDSEGLVHSVSFYRKRKKELQSRGDAIVLGQFTSSPPRDSLATIATNSKISACQDDFMAEKERLEQAIRIQIERISQASRALSVCKNTLEFRGSREEVDAQRVLLIAKETKKALEEERDRISTARAKGQQFSDSGPLGTLTISNMIVYLSSDFVNGLIHYSKNSTLYYFIVLIRHRDQLYHTPMITSEQAMSTGRLDFPHYTQIHSLPPDFSLSFDVFALRTSRELLRSKEKYHICKSSVKKTLKSPIFTSAVSSPGGSGLLDPEFCRAGHCNLNMASITKRRFRLLDVMPPLDGAIELSLQVFPEATGTVGRKGFLSLYQDVENIASWTRFWSVLSEGKLRFWRFPEDENVKRPVVVIDLRTCACDEVCAVPMENCPYPNSMQLDIWIPSERRGKNERIRIMIAADTKEEMHEWLDAMNKTMKNLCVWLPRRICS
ncbi:hypothetical protein AB6A40_005566 [Gnathostoma spinigerum]|uniref:PH domain-containing protein n=1 Tax=Gnathostoma spinigerum TaxID=75299 RepID=A0ABD6EQA2_9BILA